MAVGVNRTIRAGQCGQLGNGNECLQKQQEVKEEEMTFVYESKLRKDNIVYDKEVGLQHEIEQTFQSPPVKRSYNSSPRSSPTDSNQCCCSCMEIIGGLLYNCSRCNSSFHSICHFPALPINKGSHSSDWICHRCEMEVQYNRRHLPRIKWNLGFQEKEDVLNQSFVRFLLRLSGKDGAPSEDFSEFVNSLKAINSREFSLDKLCVEECFYKLPFDELFAKDEPNSKRCFYCKRFVEKRMVSCDFCDASFCFDCPNPPFTALPNERFMCSLHIEPFIDANLLNSKRVTERIALWKRYTELPKSDSPFRSVISCFYTKVREDNTKHHPKLKSMTTKKHQKTIEKSFKIESLIKRAYAVAEQNFSGECSNSREETPIDVGSPDDARLSIAVEALMKMHNQTEDHDMMDDFLHHFTVSESKYDVGIGFPDVFVPKVEEDANQLPLHPFNPTLFDRTQPIFATLKILSGADKSIGESDFLIPIHSSFVTLGPLEVNSLHHINLRHFTHCKMLAKQQALIFFDKAKLCFEIVSANLFDCDSFPSYKCVQKTASHSDDFVSECICQRMDAEDNDESVVLRLLDLSYEIVPSRKRLLRITQTKSMADLDQNNARNESEGRSGSANEIRAPITEAEIRAKEVVMPDDVLGLNCITENFLCRPEDNIYDIEFVRFKVRDIDSETVLFEINKPDATANDDCSEVGGNSDEAEEEGNAEEGDKPFTPRFIRYYFKPSFLRLRHIGATMEFVVGNKPINNFRMIERHYFRDRLLKSFDFDFGFIIPNSRNSCEHIYHIPHLCDSLIDEMIAAPFETKSDSFYFVDNKLVMHNKADYCYLE
ncbi:hypothetical protein niasHT_036761 [Heterodera trifolii]|uniref:PHD-type domain-containing protein n=1 Tax=Heterodera trifolii TaxID=157864 RepID=A0ABD2J4J0_9BILA